MITTNDVLRVARTGSPLLHNGGKLTAEDIVRMTTSDDWIGALYQLKTGAAQDITRTFNELHPPLPERPEKLALPAPRRPLELVSAG